jgi:hypothetical protein
MMSMASSDVVKKVREISLPGRGRRGELTITTLPFRQDNEIMYGAEIREPSVSPRQIAHIQKVLPGTVSRAKAERAAIAAAKQWVKDHADELRVQKKKSPAKKKTARWNKKGLTDAEKDILVQMGERRRRYLENPRSGSSATRLSDIRSPMTTAPLSVIMEGLVQRGAITRTVGGGYHLAISGAEVERLRPKAKTRYALWLDSKGTRKSYFEKLQDARAVAKMQPPGSGWRIVQISKDGKEKVVDKEGGVKSKKRRAAPKKRRSSTKKKASKKASGCLVWKKGKNPFGDEWEAESLKRPGAYYSITRDKVFKKGGSQYGRAGFIVSFNPQRPWISEAGSYAIEPDGKKLDYGKPYDFKKGVRGASKTLAEAKRAAALHDGCAAPKKKRSTTRKKALKKKKRSTTRKKSSLSMDEQIRLAKRALK